MYLRADEYMLYFSHSYCVCLFCENVLRRLRLNSDFMNIACLSCDDSLWSYVNGLLYCKCKMCTLYILIIVFYYDTMWSSYLIVMIS
jgi:ribosomal protein S27E